MHVYLHIYFIIQLLLCLNTVAGSLISSSEIQLCRRTSANFDPVLGRGDACNKRFVVSLAVRNGQGNSASIYADINFVDNTTGPVRRKEQLRRPFRISVTKSDVHVHYPLRYIRSVNNHPYEQYNTVHNIVLGINYCNPWEHCYDLRGYCCWSTIDEKLSRAWEYKRGVGSIVGHYFSHLYSQAICMGLDPLNYNVFEPQRPYVTYKINVTVQELDYRDTSSLNGVSRNVWKTVGYAIVGPETPGQNTNQNQVGKSSTPNIKVSWLGDFRPTTSLANFNSKYVLTPDWRSAHNVEEARQSLQVTGGPNEWLILDRHLFDLTGGRCNKIGVDVNGFVGQTNRCFQKQDSCFQVTPLKFWQKGKDFKSAGVVSHYFPPFYGEFLGPYRINGQTLQINDISNSTSNFQLIYRSTDTHKSLITLTFSADSVSFVENRSRGRIVEALVDDFTALVTSGILTVVIQNTGVVTADYSVSIDRCTEGIIRVSERTKTINPRQQVSFEFELSSSLNIDFNHSCNVELTDTDGNVLDVKQINFETQEGCVYCPAGVCTCSCEVDVDNEYDDTPEDCKDRDYLNPFWVPDVIYIEPCYHCWITNSLTHPVYATITVVVLLMSLGMCKMLICNCCCRTKDGRPIDVAGIILGTTNVEHTRLKQRTTTMYFLLGACFFVYLPLLPLLIIMCNWRRRILAKKRLKKKAERKRKRLLQRKQAALEATRGLMVLEDQITVDDAVKAFSKNKPEILIVSSSSDTDEQHFNYTTSSDTDVFEEVFGEDTNEQMLDRERKWKGKNKKKRK